MKASIAISFTRPDGATVTSSVVVEPLRLWDPSRRDFRRESRPEFNKRVRRAATTALNQVIGRA